MPKQSVLIITYYWPPAGGPGVQRWLKFAKYLPSFGIEPLVITVHPDKASYQVYDTSLISEACKIRTYYTETLEPFSLFKKTVKTDKLPIGGGDFATSRTFIKKIMLFIRGNLFIPDPRRGWNRYAYKKAKYLIKEFNIKTVITTSPPHSTQLIGLKLKRKFNVRWIADFRDPWTDIYYYKEFLHTPVAAAIDRYYEKKVLLKADKIIVVSDSIRQIFNDKVSDRNGNVIKIIPNGYDESDFSLLPVPSKPDKEKPLTVVYTGTITSLYGVEGFIKAVSELKKEGKKVKLLFIGTSDEYVHELVNSSELTDSVEFIPYVDHKKSIQFLVNEASALLLCIPKINKNKGILTGKLFEYLAARKPIIGIGPVEGEAASIISECESGEVFDYDDIEKIKEYLTELLSEKILPNQKNTNYLNYSRKGMTNQLAGIIFDGK